VANNASRGHDLSFTLDDEKHGFDLYWDDPKSPPLTVTSQETAESTAAFLKRDFPRIWHDWSGGAFHSLSPQNAGPLIYGSIGEFGTAPPVYAYTKRMRMRDPGVATTAGKVVTPTIYADSSLTTTRGLLGTPRCAFNYNGSVYIIISNGDVLKSLNGISAPFFVKNLLSAGALNVWDETGSGSKTAGTTTWVSTFDPIKVVPFNGRFYLVDRDQTKPILMFDGKNVAGAVSDAFWFKSSAVGGVADTAYWVKNNRGYDYFVCKSTRSSIKYTNQTPLQAASFSADYNIGEDQGANSIFGITNIVSSGRVILVATEQGVFTFDELGHAPNLTPHLKDSINRLNGGTARVFGEFAYFQFFEGTYRLDLKSKNISETDGWVTPGLGLPNRTPINGPIIAMSQDRDWLAAVLEANGRSWLGYGRPRKDGDPPVGPMIWHFSEYDHVGRMDFLHRGTVAATDQAPRMWMGGIDSGTGPFLVYQYLPWSSTALGDVDAIAPLTGSMLFEATGEIYLPSDPIGDANALKYVLASNIQARDLAAAVTTVEHQIRFAETASWVTLGVCDDPETWEGLPPENTIGGYQVEQRLLATGTQDAPPGLFALRTRFAVIPQSVGVRKYRLQIGKNTQSSSGGFDRKSLERDWRVINALTRAGKIRGHDRVLGDYLICRIEQAHKATPIDWDPQGNNIKFAVEIEVTVYAHGKTAPDYLDEDALYDSGVLLT
jgi:hypothetical protein